VRRLLFSGSLLDHDAYLSPLFLHRVLVKSPIFPLITIFFFSASVRFYEISWKRLFGGTKLRNLLTIICWILAWQFSLYDYNFYFDQWHWVERCSLLVSAILVFKHPVFCFPVMVLVQIIGSQFEYPLQELSWTDKRLPFDLLILFNCYLAVRAWIKTPPEMCVYVALCLVGSFYYVPALSKLNLEESPVVWIFQNDLANLFISSYVNGWLSPVPQETILRIAATLHYINPILLVFTLASEIAGLFVLFHKRYTILWLIGASLRHMEIFVVSGIWFWKWVFVDVGLAAFLISLNEKKRLDCTGRGLPCCLCS
jgi:hypothetical protein